MVDRKKNRPKKKMDRRVKYTIKVLEDALIERLQTDHISKISVKSLCEAADINRSTFYTHFLDQYDLLDYITTSALERIQIYLQDIDLGEGHLSTNALEQILTYVAQNAHVFRALLSDNCDRDIQRRVMKMTVILDAGDYQKLGERTQEYVMLFQLNGCLATLYKWLEDGTPEAPAEMSRLLLGMLGKVG